MYILDYSQPNAERGIESRQQKGKLACQCMNTYKKQVYITYYHAQCWVKNLLSRHIRTRSD